MPIEHQVRCNRLAAVVDDIRRTVQTVTTTGRHVFGARVFGETIGDRLGFDRMWLVSSESDDKFPVLLPV